MRLSEHGTNFIHSFYSLVAWLNHEIESCTLAYFFKRNLSHRTFPPQKMLVEITHLFHTRGSEIESHLDIIHAPANSIQPPLIQSQRHQPALWKRWPTLTYCLPVKSDLCNWRCNTAPKRHRRQCSGYFFRYLAYLKSSSVTNRYLRW